ncbi:uncharacterized protein KD926_007219 [Aspergillus affinis]|uniref:uncharacterized protein n=1 Tax=Aspergillus affinis TaxID=1070780 RepID=UPI0022FE767A|nr:uncharacterized protein KD926_007219 [Aspergillus affinis]KAI9041265.1 hypothetical protein KD926_007219 [Aspergillus affinis]
MERVRDDNKSLQRPGQKRKLTEEYRDHIYDRIHTDHHVTYDTLINEIDEAVLKRSIQNLTREWGKRKWRQKRRPEIKPEHAVKRLAWAREYEFMTPEDWACVKWSDECTVERGVGKRPIWTWLRPQEQLQQHDLHLVRCGKGVKRMFWAAFGEQTRTGLIPLDGDPYSAGGGVTGKIIADLYRAFLPEIVHPGDIFMHDNASVHTSHILRDILRDMGIQVMVWPPYSPDLNPIENLWALMKEEIYKLYPELEHANDTELTRQLLIQAAKEAWQAIEQRILVRLSQTMPHRVKAVIESQGWYTKY